MELRPGQRVACHHPENAESLTIPGARESVEITKAPEPAEAEAPATTSEPVAEPTAEDDASKA